MVEGGAGRGRDFSSSVKTFAVDSRKVSLLTNVIIP